MDLGYFIYSHKVTLKAIAEKYSLNRSTINNLKQRRQSPTLLTAMKLKHAANDEISYEEMLSHSDVVHFNEWKNKHPNL